MGRALHAQSATLGERMSDRMFQVIVAGGLALVGCGGAVRADAAGAIDGAASPPDAATTSNDASVVDVFPSELPSRVIDASVQDPDSGSLDLDSGFDGYMDAATDARIGVPTEGPPR